MRRVVLGLAIAGGVASCELFVDASHLDTDVGGNRVDANVPDVVVPVDAGTDVQVFEAGPPPTNGLVGYWSFDETSGTTAHDSSGDGNDGQLQGGATFVPGKVGNAVSFDGTTGVVVIPDSASLDITQAITIAMWINVAASDQNRLISKENAYDIKLNTGSPQFSAGSSFAEFATTVALNEWHHVAMSYATGVTRSYLDGVSQIQTKTTFASGAPLAAGTTLRIAAYEGETQNHTMGLIDEVRIYNRALADSEIAALAKTP